MAKYEVNFSCGHTEVKELFGKTSERERKINYWEKYGVCTSCYREQREIEMLINHNEIEMSYREYKTSYPQLKTKSGSYDGIKKTVIVYVPKKEEK